MRQGRGGTFPGGFQRSRFVDLVRSRKLATAVTDSAPPTTSVEVSLGIIAKRTIGFSGAQLANLMNEAAIVAARRDKTEITYAEVDYAIDRLTVRAKTRRE